MTAQDADRPVGRPAAVARAARERPRHGGSLAAVAGAWARPRNGGCRAALALLLAAAAGAGAAATDAPASTSGATAGSPSETTIASVWCSTLGKRISTSGREPVKLTAGVGSMQSTPAGARFPIPLAVTLTDAKSNPVPGVPVTFSAPPAGASGRFTTDTPDPDHHAHVSHPHTVEIKTNACGIAVAPPFTANDTQGGYIVKATVRHVRPAAFALVNEAPGQSQ